MSLTPDISRPPQQNTNLPDKTLTVPDFGLHRLSRSRETTPDLLATVLLQQAVIGQISGATEPPAPAMAKQTRSVEFDFHTIFDPSEWTAVTFNHTPACDSTAPHSTKDSDDSCRKDLGPTDFELARKKHIKICRQDSGAFKYDSDSKGQNQKSVPALHQEIRDKLRELCLERSETTDSSRSSCSVGCQTLESRIRKLSSEQVVSFEIRKLRSPNLLHTASPRSSFG